MKRKLIPSVKWIARKALYHIFEEPLCTLERKMLEDGIDEQSRKSEITSWEKNTMQAVIDLLVRNEQGELEKMKETCRIHNVPWQSFYTDLLGIR